MRRMIRAVLAAAAAGSVVTAVAQNEFEYKLQIERAPIAEALTAFSQQTGLYVSYVTKPQSTSALLVGPLQGQYTVESALEQITAGTGLTYQRVKANTVVIVAKAAPPIRLARLDAEWPAAPASRKAAARPEASQDKTIEEVFVTAQKRSERLQDVPISISVLGGTHLDKSTAQGVTEALNSVPGVATTEHYAGGTHVTVRGVSAGAPVFDGSSPIAYYLDSVPFGFVRTAVAPDASAYDLERVEVLRGPQGTLYGATALNGVVRILTKDADLEKLQFKVRTSASATEDGGENYRGDVAVNVPIVEGKLAVRAVAGYEDLSGWIDRPAGEDMNDAELSNLRLKVNAQPTDEFSIGLSAWTTRSDYGAPSTSGDGETNGSLEDESLTIDYDVYGLKLGYELPAFTVTSATSYIDYTNDGNVDFTPLGIPAVLNTDLNSRVVSEEVTFSSNPGDTAWRWSFGGFYRDAKDHTVQSLGTPLIDFTDTSESYAVFGELTRLLADGRVELTAGLRYFEDKVGVRGTEFGAGAPKSQTFDATSPRVVLTWHVQDAATLYLSYAEGFRSGANQTPGVIAIDPNFPSADADTLRNYELGAKGTLADGRVTYDSAIYYIDWQDVQQAVTIGELGFAALLNGESASGMGVDLSVVAQPTDALQLGVNFSWNDLRMDGAVFSNGLELIHSGDRLDRSPEYTAGALLGYSFPLGGSSLEGQFNASLNYISEQTTRAIFGTAALVGTGDETLVGRASFAVNANDRWSARLFVDNVTDERGVTVSPPFGVSDWSSRLRPRTIGVQLEYRFY